MPTIENTTNLEAQNALGAHFYSELSMDYSGLVYGLLANRKIVLEDKLGCAKIAFANYAMSEDMWRERNEKMTECKIITSNIDLIISLEADLLSILPPKNGAG